MRKPIAKASETCPSGRSGRRSSSSAASRPLIALLRLCALVVPCALVLAIGSAQAQTGPPTIGDVGANEVTDTSAVLGGRVAPNGSHTTYRFEYGTDISYGNATPLDNVGSGTASVPVSKPVTGLQPSTTYHFHLVATNASGDTPGPDATFTTAAQPPQPSGRAYEMVSPLDKNGGHIARDLNLTNFAHQTGASTSGDAVAFVSRVNFGDLEAGTLLFPNYAARRASNGWATEGITPRMLDGRPGTQIPGVLGLSPDLSSAFVLSDFQFTPNAATLNGSRGLYMRRIGPTAERYQLLSVRQAGLQPDTPDSATSGPNRFEYEASTPDLRHVVFSSSRQLLSDALGDAQQAGTPNAVYEWVDGSVRLVSALPEGLALDSGPLVIGGGGINTRRVSPGELHGDHLISDDGRRIFFQAKVVRGDGISLGSQLFVREDGANTRRVSRSQLTDEDDPTLARLARFWAAKRSDGSVALFTNHVPLTAGAGNGSLYRWDANAPEGSALTELSEDRPPQPGDPPQPGVLGPAAVSEDASSVYFVAAGVLADGATRDQPNLYLWREGDGVRHIATLDSTSVPGGIPNSADRMMWELVWRNGSRGARVSADGERLLFASYAQPDQLGVTYDTTEDSPDACGNPTAAGDRCRQIYLYDARTDSTSCVTCVSGVPLSGDANLFGNGDGRRPAGSEPTVDAPLSLPRNLSADGRRAFFETDRPLVSADKNAAIDVYEWEDRDLDGQGELRLVSSGRNTTDSLFLDASLSGDDVFFTTRDQLVGIDTDDQVDLYDARVGGGIPAQNPAPPPPPCEGELCQGAFSAAPVLPGLGSGGATHGNLRPRPRPSFSVARLSRDQQKQLARGKRVMVSVRVNRGGRVSLTARAKLGRLMQPVDRASKVARKAGLVGLGVKLSDRARRALARKERLNVRLTVRFAGVREATASTLHLRRARSSGERTAR